MVLINMWINHSQQTFNFHIVEKNNIFDGTDDSSARVSEGQGSFSTFH